MIAAKSFIYHDCRRKKADGTYPVKLRITFDREQRYYPLGLSVNKDDWEKMHQENPRKENRDNKLFVAKVEEKAINIIKDLDSFTFEAFEKKFNKNTPTRKELFVLIQEYIDKLTKEQRLSTAGSHQSALSSFKDYAASIKKSKFLLRDLTQDWCTAYEKWKTEEGFALGTVGVHMRNLRTILNIAIEDGILPQESYPFGKRKYEIPSSKNVKKALSIDDVKKIVDYIPKTKAEERARDIWLFSYLASGINMRDIAMLQYKSVGSKSITFIREKTKRSTKKNLKPVIVPIFGNAG